jgi:hypothetical protein
MKSIDRLISEQVLTWSKREALAKKRNRAPEIWPVITISREYGAKGRSLADDLGKRTGFKIWDKSLLSAIADEAGADELFLASIDERRRKLIDDALHGSLMGAKHSNTHYYRSLLSVVQTIGVHGKSVIVGRGANYIINSPDPLRIRIVCPVDLRVKFVAKSENITEKEAEKLIKSKDADRVDFIRHFFKKDPNDPHDYDLVLNSGVFSLEAMTDLVLYAYEKKVGKAIVQTT